MYINFAPFLSWFLFFNWLSAWALWFIFRFNIGLCSILFYRLFTIAYMIQNIDSYSALQFFHRYSLNNSLSGHKKKEWKRKKGKIEGKRKDSICFQEREIQSSYIQKIKSSLKPKVPICVGHCTRNRSPQINILKP